MLQLRDFKIFLALCVAAVNAVQYYYDGHVDYNVYVPYRGEYCDVYYYPHHKEYRNCHYDRYGYRYNSWEYWVWGSISFILFICLICMLIWCCCGSKTRTQGQVISENTVLVNGTPGTANYTTPQQQPSQTTIVATPGQTIVVPRGGQVDIQGVRVDGTAQAIAQPQQVQGQPVQQQRQRRNSYPGIQPPATGVQPVASSSTQPAHPRIPNDQFSPTHN